MKTLAVALMTFALLPAAVYGPALTPARALAQAKPEAASAPVRGAAREVVVRGTVAAVDKAKQTVTLKGPKGGTLTLEVRDPQKLEVINVGDPVVARYYESVAVEVKKAGSTTPGASAKETVTSSKPGETPAGAVGREITVTATITAIDKKAQTVTIKGPEGNTETVKARDPKNLDKVKVGDLVEITYAQALAVSLDKPAAKPAKADAPRRPGQEVGRNRAAAAANGCSRRAVPPGRAAYRARHMVAASQSPPTPISRPSITRIGRGNRGSQAARPTAHMSAAHRGNTPRFQMTLAIVSAPIARRRSPRSITPVPRPR